jgi:hypothetical protein
MAENRRKEIGIRTATFNPVDAIKHKRFKKFSILNYKYVSLWGINCIIMKKTTMKTKISVKTIVRYIRDFSIVVAGIAVTLYVNDKVTNKGEKRDLKLYLNAIMLEMEENIKIINEEIDYWQASAKYTDYLRSTPKKSLDRDSLLTYRETWFWTKSSTFKANAFEMFKNSGIMRLVDNKELLMSLWDAYTDLTQLKQVLDWVFQNKWDEMKQELSTNDAGVINLSSAPMYNFFSVGTPTTMLQACESTLKKIEDVVAMLNKELSD